MIINKIINKVLNAEMKKTFMHIYNFFLDIRSQEAAVKMRSLQWFIQYISAYQSCKNKKNKKFDHFLNKRVAVRLLKSEIKS